MKALAQMILMVVFWAIFAAVLYQIAKKFSLGSDPDNQMTACGICAIALSMATVIAIT